MKIKVKNVTGRCGRAVPNQFIVDAGNAEFFQSYNTVVVRLLAGGITLDPKWNFSKTTSKYVGRYLGINSKEIERKIKSGEFKVENLN